MSAERRRRRIRKYMERRTEVARRPLICGDLGGVRRVVVIPALAEEGHLFETLASLGRCEAEARSKTLVICVVNNRAEPWARGDQIADNRRTLDRLEALVGGRGGERRAGGLRLGFVDASSPGREIGPEMGVGEARKIGLDHGLAVLASLGEERGPLICLDADCTVAPSYLGEIGRHFEGSGAWAAIVAYEHSLPLDRQRRAAILSYEIFLRYQELGLRFARSPYAFPTIGSTITCRGDAYVAAGGMNRRQAAEDFYFLQQLAKTGAVGRIDSTRVHPSARTSDRVPFGTGASITHNLSDGGGPLTASHPAVFRILGDWLALVSGGLDQEGPELLRRAGDISTHLREFLVASRFERVWPRLQQNASSPEALEAQLHRWFDGLKTLRLIHHLRDRQLPQRPLFEAVHELLDLVGIDLEGMVWQNLAENLPGQERLLDLLRSLGPLTRSELVGEPHAAAEREETVAAVSSILSDSEPRMPERTE